MRKSEFVKEDIFWYQRLPARKKLKLLQELNGFFQRAMPEKSKENWKKLQKLGF